MDIAVFDRERDGDAALRIWEEVGWLDRSSEAQIRRANGIIDSGNAWVSRIDGDAECQVTTCEGRMRYLSEDLPFSGVTAVVTSRIARKQGIAGRLTAHAVAQDAKAGALVCGLGMFEQGFYDRLGFGTGPCDQQIGFDPRMLNVPFATRAPKRFTSEDAARLHQARLNARKEHGYVTFFSQKLTESDIANSTNGFGLGYVDASGAITHHFWCNATEPGHGPYHIKWITFQNREQFLELLGVIRSLGDQVRLMTLIEPPFIQMQDFVSEPIQSRAVTRGSDLATFGRNLAWWQHRIVDLPGCLAQTHLHGPTLQFNLELSDPITTYLSDDEPWRGIGGEYTITLGEESCATPGTRTELPTLKTSVGAFTRLWLGCLRPAGLHYADTFEASDALLTALEKSMTVPTPGLDWDF